MKAASTREVVKRQLNHEGTWALIPVLIVALALRGLALGERNTWYDEISSILFAERDLTTIVQATAADTMPPLYYFLLHYWLVLGNNLWVARSLSLVLSLGMVVISFVVARRLFGPRVALFASLLVSVNPFQVYHGQEVRMYTLLGFSQLLAIYFFLRCLENGGLRNWLGFVISQSVSMYTHNAAFLSLLAIDAYVFGAALFYNLKTMSAHNGKGMVLPPEGLCSYNHRTQFGKFLGDPIAFLRNLLFANIAVFAIFSPWLIFLPGQIGKVTRAFWTQPPGVAEAIRSIVVFTFNLPSPAPWALPALLAVSLLLFALLAYTVAMATRQKEGSPAVVLATSLFAGPMVFAALVSVVRPIYVERVFITSSVLYLVLLAWLGGRLRPRIMGLLFFLPMLILSAWSLVSYYQYASFPRADFTAAVAYLEKYYASGDAIVHDNKLTFFPGYYLNRTLPHQFLADPAWSINDTFALQTQEALGLRPSSLEEATRGKARVWFLIFRQALAEAEEQGRIHENKDWLEKRFDMLGEERLGDLIIYFYAAE